jgi:phytoene synthase
MTVTSDTAATTETLASQPAGPFPVRGRRMAVADGSTFAPALRCLAARERVDVECLYRVLRTLDDLVDGGDPSASERLGAVERWARGEAAVCREAHALQDLHRRRPFAREALLCFCAGMRHDIERAGIEDEQDFERYCQQAGGSVGIVLADLLGARSEHAHAKMAALGRAMQVTNILRDIDEDLEHGRLYIPRTLIERFGFPAPGAREPLLRELIARADALYDEGASAIALLGDGGGAMAVAAALYREILRQIERDGFGREPGRAIVPAWRTRSLLARHRTANVWVGR